MNKSSKYLKAVIVLIMITMITQSLLPINHSAVAQAAAKIKISEKNLILNIGDTDILTVLGTKKKAIWSSSDETIVSVSSKGIIVALKEGNVQITAQVQNKTYSCKIVVLHPENPYLKNAPFVAQEADFGNFNTIIPKGWSTNIDKEEGDNISVDITPPADNISLEDSGIFVFITNTGNPAPEYSVAKEYFSKLYSMDSLVKGFTSEKNEPSITDLVTSDVVTTIGTAYKVEFNLLNKKDANSKMIKVMFYNLMIDNYYINVAITDDGQNITPDYKTVAEYMLNSIQVVK